MSPSDLAGSFRGTVFVSACEPSADLYAALFIRHIKKNRPGLRFIGIGGPEMAGAGVELVADFRKLMSFGFSAAAQNAAGNAVMYRTIARKLYHSRPDIFLPVAYPGLNLPLCRYCNKLGIRTYYLLPPQIWAWGNFRKYFIKKWVDLVITFLPVEYEHYRRCTTPTILMDNPLIHHLASYHRNDHTLTIGFMPGSRPQEIIRNTLVMMRLMDQIKADYNKCRFITILREKLALSNKLNPIAYQGTHERYQAMKNCDFLIICSGTASLEAAFMNIPQVFFNRPSWLDYYLVKPFLSTSEYNLANLFFGDHRVPALVSRDIRQLSKHVKYALTRMDI